MGGKYLVKRFVPLLLLYLALINCSKVQIDFKDITVGVIPYKGISTRKIDLIAKAITDYYGVTVKVLPQQGIPIAAFVTIKSPRYRADSLIAIQERNIPEGVGYILGLTEKDISVTKHDKSGAIKSPEWRYNDFGVMGLAYCPGNSCVVSDFRLKSGNKELQVTRFKKVVIHELGHNFGLPHCPDKRCVMTDAVESIKTIDGAKPGLCAACKSKLNI